MLSGLACFEEFSISVILPELSFPSSAFPLLVCLRPLRPHTCYRFRRLLQRAWRNLGNLDHPRNRRQHIMSKSPWWRKQTSKSRSGDSQHSTSRTRVFAHQGPEGELQKRKEAAGPPARLPDPHLASVPGLRDPPSPSRLPMPRTPDLHDLPSLAGLPGLPGLSDLPACLTSLLGFPSFP